MTHPAENLYEAGETPSGGINGQGLAALANKTAEEWQDEIAQELTDAYTDAETGFASNLVSNGLADTALQSGDDISSDVASAINSASGKSTPVDADKLGLADSAASWALKSLTWANIKTTIKTYYDAVASTFTNKTISLGSNTLAGTTAQFNTALTDGDFATLAGTETLSGKTLTTPVIQTIRDTSGNTILDTVATGSANYVRVYNAAASGTPKLVAAGSDSSISISVEPKGSGKYQLYASSGNTIYIQATGADSNHDLGLRTKGTGTFITWQESGDAGWDINGADTDVGFNFELQGAGTLQQDGVDVATVSDTQTLSNKTVDLTDNTISGTTAEFNTALSDGDFCTLAGTETLSGKTLTSPTINNADELSVGTTTSTATATPEFVSFGGTYGNNTPGSSGNLKLALYHSSSGTKYGLGVSANKLEYQVVGSGTHNFYVAGTVRVTVDSTGIDTTGVTISGGPTVTSGTGSPESSATAPQGSLFLRTDGGASTTLYVKESGSGNTGWVGK